MKYRLHKFSEAVAYYTTALRLLLRSGDSCLVELPLNNRDAFFSLAPLSRAVHELNAEMSLFVLDGKSETLEALKRAWKAFRSSGEKKEALMDFIEAVNRKTKSREFERLFMEPELLVTASRGCFVLRTLNGNERLVFKAEWFRRRRWRQLLATCKRILSQGFNLRKSERFSISFELIPKRKELELPLEDYLDNFSIGYAMALSAKRMCKRVSLGSSTSKLSQLEPMERVSDLAATLLGCEYEKSINEPWFRKFRRVSKLLRLDRLRVSEAAFGIHGRGYSGKHFFGLAVGYPTPNRKSRWQSPGQMFLKPFWLVQSRVDGRKPLTRYAITETLPIESFIRTCNIDYFRLREIDDRVRAIIRRGKTLFVEGCPVANERTHLRADLSRILGRKSPVLASDIEVNPDTEREAAAIFKVDHGRYGNFPGGEVFFTPYGLDGTFVGDVVINIDQSYVIPKRRPLVVKIKGGRYRVKCGSRRILKALEKRKRESWKLIKLFERNRSLPKSVIECYKKNFDMVGEFAINTNPKARLSRYLIETEKLAKMMHIALGSGYEPNRETTYHCDIVLNCPRQRINIFVVTPENEALWIMRGGRLVV